MTFDCLLDSSWLLSDLSPFQAGVLPIASSHPLLSPGPISLTSTSEI